jgi:hypothetical protein
VALFADQQSALKAGKVMGREGVRLGQRDGVEQNANECDFATGDFGGDWGGGVGVCG